MIAHAGASREQTPRSRPAPSATGARRGGAPEPAGAGGQAMGRRAPGPARAGGRWGGGRRRAAPAAASGCRGRAGSRAMGRWAPGGRWSGGPARRRWRTMEQQASGRRWAMGAGAGRPGAIGGARRGRQGDAQRDPDGRWGVSGQFRYGLRCRRRLHLPSLTSSNLFSQVRSYSEKTMSPRRRSRCVNRGEIGHKSENSVPGRPSPVCQRRIRRPDRPAGAPPRITRRPLRRRPPATARRLAR